MGNVYNVHYIVINVKHQHNVQIAPMVFIRYKINPDYVIHVQYIVSHVSHNPHAYNVQMVITYIIIYVPHAQLIIVLIVKHKIVHKYLVIYVYKVIIIINKRYHVSIVQLIVQFAITLIIVYNALMVITYPIMGHV